MESWNTLERKLLDLGASFTGTSQVKGKVLPDFQGLDYAVTVGIHLSDFVIEQIEEAPTFTYFHHYRTVNALIDQITLQGVLMIQQAGFAAVAVPASQTVNNLEDKYAGIFPHKTAAVLAGLGWMGKNGLFISAEYGPRVRLGTILTNMPLPCKNNILPVGCHECNRCVKSCPAGALTGNTWFEGCGRGHIVDAKACSDFMSGHFKHIGRGSVCGICIKACPYGSKKRDAKTHV